LFAHGFGDIDWGIDFLELDFGDFDAPRVGGFVEHGAQLGVDGVAGGEGLVELLVSDEIAEVGLGQRGGGYLEVFDLEGGFDGVDDLVVDDGVDGDDDVVFGDDLLGEDVDDLLAHVDGDEVVYEGDDEGESGVGGSVVFAEADDEAFLVLFDYSEAFGNCG